jgi:hypothetical protein
MRCMQHPPTGEVCVCECARAPRASVRAFVYLKGLVLPKVYFYPCFRSSPSHHAAPRNLRNLRVKGIANIRRRTGVLLRSVIAHPVFVVALGRAQRKRPAVLVRNVVLWLELEDLVPLPRRRCVMLQIIYTFTYTHAHAHAHTHTHTHTHTQIFIGFRV